MTYKAGEWLFEAMGQIPNEMILEAEQDALNGELTEGELSKGELSNVELSNVEISNAEHSKGELSNGALSKGEPLNEAVCFDGQETANGCHQEIDSADRKKHLRKQRRYIRKQKIGACLKYLPVAACLCIVFGTAAFLVQNVPVVDKSAENTDLFVPESNEMNDIVQDTKEEASQEYDENAADGMQNDIGAGEAGNSAVSKPDDKKQSMLPVRYDSYEGPVLALTATGDTQSLKTTRRLKADVTAVSYEKDVQPVLDLQDNYRIKNTAKEDKTVQLVYPFAASLNLGYGFEDTILQVTGEEALDVSYGIGDGVGTYLGAKPTDPVKLSDYRSLLKQETDYQENALQKEANWDKQVCVYFFTNIQVQKDCTGVIGVTVTGEDADVLTYGFDYAAPIGEDGSANYCFFAPKEHSRIMLIVTGEQVLEPKIGYYTNLDCEEEAQGIQCQAQKQYMSYSDALRLCSESMTEQMHQLYADDVFAGTLPSYVNKDTVYQALTVMSDESTFFDTLTERYNSTDLEEIYEIMFCQTRIVYAMAMVTIPAKGTVSVTAHTQKRQMEGNYMLMTDQPVKKKDYRYDFLTFQNNRLNMNKTEFTLKLPDGWKLAAENIGMSKKKSIWEAQTEKEISYVTITGR